MSLPASKSYGLHQPSVLAEYDKDSGDNAEFWDKLWRSDNIAKSLELGGQGRLIGMEFLLRRIPKQGIVLEAGCGNGHIVAALKSHGYQVMGVDFAKQTIDLANKLKPELNLLFGDIRSLPFNDNFFRSYLSFGVIEHFTDSSIVASILREAKRVTSDQLFISVPYFSPMLQKKFTNRLLRVSSHDDQFYQYYYTKASFKKLLAEHGLTPFAFDYYATIVAMRRHHRLFGSMCGFPPFRLVARRGRCWLDRFYGSNAGHMIGAWCRKDSI